MFVNYARQLLAAEGGLSEEVKRRLASDIERWAKRNNVKEIGKVHRVLDEWVDIKKNKISTVPFDGLDEETPGLSEFLQDKIAASPADIVIAVGEFSRPTYKKATEFVTEHMEGEPQELLLEALKPCRGRYVVDESHPVVRQNAAILEPRIKKGQLLVPKKLVSFKLGHNIFEIKYRQGFSDENVNEVLRLYSQGLNSTSIAEKTGMKWSTVRRWLYVMMDLPRIGPYDSARVEKRNERYTEILKLYDSGMRSMEIAERLGCSSATVCEVISDFRGVEFGWGGPDPWVYTPTGRISSTTELIGLDLRMKKHQRGPKKNYDCNQRYGQVLTAVTVFHRNEGRGPTRDEVEDALKFNTWTYLNDMVELGVLRKERLPKERVGSYARSCRV